MAARNKHSWLKEPQIVVYGIASGNRYLDIWSFGTLKKTGDSLNESNRFGRDRAIYAARRVLGRAVVLDLRVARISGSGRVGRSITPMYLFPSPPEPALAALEETDGFGVGLLEAL